jgi:hypothetical protein
MVAMCALLAAASIVPAVKPPAETVRAFEAYVAKAEERIRLEESPVESFVTVRSKPASTQQAALRRGEVVVERRGEAAPDIPGGMIHDWQGTVFIPGATVGDVLAVVQDYDHVARYYSPEVMTSRLIAREGGDFRIGLRMREHKVVTVVMDAEYAVHYGRLDAEHQFSFSRSMRVTEIADAGGPDERALSEEENHGYLWRLNSYWRFAQAEGGAMVQCEAISLTRGVPAGLGWLVVPFAKEIPRESLGEALGATRAAVMQTANQRAEKR